MAEVSSYNTGTNTCYSHVAIICYLCDNMHGMLSVYVVHGRNNAEIIYRTADIGLFGG